MEPYRTTVHVALHLGVYTHPQRTSTHTYCNSDVRQKPRKGLSCEDPPGAFVLALTNTIGNSAAAPRRAELHKLHARPLVSARLTASAAMEHKTVAAKAKTAYLTSERGQLGFQSLLRVFVGKLLVFMPPPWYQSYEIHAGWNWRCADEASHRAKSPSSRERLALPVTCHRVR